MKKLVVSFIFLVGVVGIGATLFFNNYLDQKIPIDETFVFNIEKGESLHSVARRLHQQGIVENPRVFVKIGQIAGYAQGLKFGEYQVEPGQSFDQMLKHFSSGKTLQHQVVLTEGSHLYDLAKIVASKGFGHRGRVLPTCERWKIY